MGEEIEKRRRNRLSLGCIAGLIFLLVLVLGGLVGLHFAKKMFNDFTDARPDELPRVQMSKSEIDALEKRIDVFRQAVRAGKPPGPLTLNSDEINALIQTDPDFRQLKGKLYITLSGDQIQGQLSIPLESVGLAVFKGRYLNGTGMFGLSLHNGKIAVNTLSFVVKGKPVPEAYMQEIRKHNLAQEMNNEPRIAAALDSLKDIKVQDGKLIVVPK